MIGLLDSFPLWAVSLFIFLLTLGSFEVGFRFGCRKSHEGAAALGTVVGAGIGLLAFFLAFTFGIAASRFDTRRQLVVQEANAIGTAYLRAQIVPDPYGSEIRRLLRDYTDERIAASRTGDIEALLARSGEIHRRLWTEVAALGRSEPTSEVTALLIESLNEVIDLHQMRLTFGLRTRIPEAVWDVLFLLTAVAMAALGYHAGETQPVRSPVIFLLALGFSSVIFIVADLDRPLEGWLRVSQQALIDTRESMDR
ncbi:MAG TPA: hypothetical protein VIE88_10715 [Vicinamibacteria bacterium]